MAQAESLITGAFGRHETFPLRFGWLTKGYQTWFDAEQAFQDDEATVLLGVGKNMVSAIRHWMLASQVAGRAQGGGLEPTKIGRLLFAPEGLDPYLEYDSTIWLLHWLMCSNASEFTTGFWFFNRYHKPEFSAKELFDALKDYAVRDNRWRVSDATLKADISLLLRMYQPSIQSRLAPLEESLDSPLSMLGLINPRDGSKIHESRFSVRRNLPLGAFCYAVVDVFQRSGVNNIPIERLLRGGGTLSAPGSTFRLSEEGLVLKIEEMIAKLPDVFQLRETAGVHLLFKLREVDPLDLLESFYNRKN